MLQREQIDFLLTNAYNASIRAGAKVMEIYRSDDFNINLKSDSTPITLADREAHALIKNFLGRTRIPLMSEEGRNMLYEERCHWDLFWLIDPLDGTKEFIKRNGEFTINIALMVDNVPSMGVVYVPCFNKIYFADPERGAFSKENVVPDEAANFGIAEIYASARKLPAIERKNGPVRIVISRSHVSPETHHFIELMKMKHGENVTVIERGSSMKFCMVAEGEADYYVRTTRTFEWDTAAGDAIATTAGARTIDLNQETLRYNKTDLQNPFFVCRSKFIED